MKQRIFLFLFLCCTSLFCMAQVEGEKDTLIIRQDKIDEFINEMNTGSQGVGFMDASSVSAPPSLTNSLRMPEFDFTLKEEMPRISPYTFKGDPFGHDYIDGRAYQINRTGVLSGFHSFTGLPTIGEMQNVGVMYTQQLNDFISLTGGVYAAKYNVYGARFNDFGTQGRLSFRVNERMRINMFGTYSFNNKYGVTPMVQPYMNQTSYGGSLEFKISDRFGLEVGAEREFNVATRKWEIHPIISPVFYKDK
ncbi:hypothetical protein [Phocaeicola sp.]